MKLWDYLESKMKEYRNKLAFANSGLTYGDLLAFKKQGGKKTLKICEGETKEAQALNILKCLAEGNAAVPVTKDYGNKNYNHIISVVKNSDEDVNDLAFLMFTSGTTGVPKGVMLTDENIISNLEYISTYFDLRNTKSICIARPLVHIAVLTGELLYALVNGLTVYFYEEPFMPQRLLSYLYFNRIDVFCATPTFFETLAKVDKGNFTVKAAAISGEILSEKTGRKIAESFPDTAFYNVYGLTEHSPRVSALLPNEFKKRPDSVGKPIGNVKLKIENGELCVKSSSVMKGYFADKERTKEKITNGWLKTGDRAHFDCEGFLFIDGRADNMLIRSGINVYPEEIELAAKNIVGVDDCVVYGNGNAICMKYVGDAEVNALRKKLAEVLNPAIIPSEIYKEKALEKTASGKKLRR